jgi:hypothetical protein
MQYNMTQLDSINQSVEYDFSSYIVPPVVVVDDVLASAFVAIVIEIVIVARPYVIG